MRKGDILILSMRYGSKRVRERSKVVKVTDTSVGEVFIVELIEGAFDGERYRLTRAELDANQEIDPGGEQWKTES